MQGSMEWASLELLGVPHWVKDSAVNRFAIGLSLCVTFAVSGVFVARRRLNTLIVSGEFDGIDETSTNGACTECGYVADAPIDLCPECGSQLQTHRRVLFIWPRLLGTPTRVKRRRVRIALAALIACLLVAPLWVGVLRVVLGSL